MSRRSELTTKVFVGSLPPNVTADDLRQLFAPYGEIAECDIANRCGFLHLEDKDLAEKAIRELNDTTFMGGRISVEKGRVKSRGDRRMRGGPGGGGGGAGGGGGGRGGGIGGRKRDMGPYSREGGYPRGGGGGGGGGGMPPRNNFRDNYRSYDEYRDYGGRYDDRYERRPPPMYDDRRGASNGGSYMSDRSSYSNGYDRRPYPDDRPPYGDSMSRPYDDARMPPGAAGPPTGYSDRRDVPPSIADRRPLLDDQSLTQSAMRPQGYDRPPQQSAGDIYSRREVQPKPLAGAYDRSVQSGYSTYGSMTSNIGYSNSAPSTGSYGSTGGAISSYNPPLQTASYGDNRGTTGYDSVRPQSGGMSNQGYSTGSISTGNGYNTVPQSATGGGYGDSYGIRTQASSYDTSYPPLPQQRGFAGGNAPGPHRDMPPARRY